MIQFVTKRYKRLLKSFSSKKERFHKRILNIKINNYCKILANEEDKISYSQYRQDLFVKYYYRNYRGGGLFFVDIGANDGISLSNTYSLELSKKQKWKGILIEADKNVFDKSCKTRPNTPKYNVALCDVDGEIEFMQIEGPHQMLSGIISKYDDKHVQRIKRDIARDGGSCEIIAMQGATFDTIMANHPDIKKIDYMSIDVEGGEMSILENINFEKYNIKLLGIEDNYPDTSGIVEFMTKKGYKKIANLGCDVFFEKMEN